MATAPTTPTIMLMTDIARTAWILDQLPPTTSIGVVNCCRLT
jgi:hypothetical protein